MFDIVGVLILVGLVGLFGFLTFRSVKARNRLVKWIGTLLAGLLTLVSAALLILALVGFGKLNTRFNNPVATIQVANTPEQIARGSQLAQLCTNCHTKDNQLPLSGSDMIAKFGMPGLGTLYAPNLTPAGNIQDWSDGEIIRAIREGVAKDGRSLLVMPSEVFRHMSDEDVQALVAYLRSQPPTGEPTPTNHFNVLGALFMNLDDFRTVQSPVGRVTAPSPGTPAYGEYMVSVIGCQSCHGDRLQGKVDNGQPGPPPGPNLTQIIPNWSEDQFMAFFNTGQLPGGGTVPVLTLPSGFSEPRMPWTEVRAATTDDELHVMYLYLHSLQPIDGSAQ